MDSSRLNPFEVRLQLLAKHLGFTQLARVMLALLRLFPAVQMIPGRRPPSQ
jgi:hypothetical protein